MKWFCPDCDVELIHHDGSSNWECPNWECPVSYVKLCKSPIKGVVQRVINRVVYVTVI